ncbi:MAG: hypothetical protein WBC71_14880 [Salaquimonas sp.]
MLRPLDIVMIGLLLGGAAFTFKVKQDSEAAIDRVTALQKKIEAEQDAIDVLKADWSLLTDPKRLQDLVARYQDQLGVEQLDPSAIGKVTDIPIKPLEIEEPADTGIAGLIDGGADTSVHTGAVNNGAAQ